MHKLELTTYNRGFKREYPESWNELSAAQLLYVAFLMSKEYELEKYNILLLKNFLNIKGRLFYKITGAAVTELADTISFIHEKKELTYNKLPVLKFKKGLKKYKLYGPDNGMLNLTFEQFFGHCEPALNNYIKTKDIRSLNYLVASLYTFEKGKFNPDDIEKIKKSVKRLHIKYKIAVLLFYLGCKDFFAYKFQKLFKVEKNSSNKEVSDFYFIELTDQLNNENLSNNEQIKKTNITEAFIRLTRMIELSEQLKRKQNARRN